MISLDGVGASPGIAFGKVKLLQEHSVKVEIKTVPLESVDKEISRLRDAVDRSKTALSLICEHTRDKIGQEEAAVFTAHLMILDDPELVPAIETKIRAEHLCAEAAVSEVIRFHTEMLLALEDEYIRARAADIEDIGQRLLSILVNAAPEKVELNEKVILVARDLSPSVTAQLNTELVLAFATQAGSRASHTAILARCLGIPAVVGLGDKLLKAVAESDDIIVDGNGGKLLINPDEKTIEHYRVKQGLEEQENERLRIFKNRDALTADGLRIKVMGNIGAVNETELVLKHGGEGVGLFRTEFLFMGKDCLPTEDEQFDFYRVVVEKMAGKEVVIRTLDIGGDKGLASLHLPEEENPFLGYRAIRICLEYSDIFRPQLKAILRAGLHGDLKVMFPMISSLEELRFAREALEAAKGELRADGVPFKEDIEVGIMIEVPAAALMADALAQEVDFFSIGTNDLVQYTLAADRNNEKVSAIYTPYHPAVIKLIKMVTDAAHARGIWVGMCGEASGDALLLPLWIGLRFSELSMSAASILKTKEIISNWTVPEAMKIVEQVLASYTATEVLDLLQSAGKRFCGPKANDRSDELL